MTHPALDGVYAKVERAREHLKTLDDAVGAWQASDPYTIVFESNPERTEHTFRHRLKNPIPPRWGTVVGDVMHNMRSALDHLAAQLAIRDRNDPGRTSQFPIFNDPRDYNAKGLPRLAQITDPAVRAAIEEVQPYAHGQNYRVNALWILNELNRIDKHQLLNPVLINLNDIEHNITIEFDSADAASRNTPPNLELFGDAQVVDGAIAAIYRASDPCEVKMGRVGMRATLILEPGRAEPQPFMQCVGSVCNGTLITIDWFANAFF